MPKKVRIGMFATIAGARLSYFFDLLTQIIYNINKQKIKIKIRIYALESYLKV